MREDREIICGFCIGLRTGCNIIGAIQILSGLASLTLSSISLGFGELTFQRVIDATYYRTGLVTNVVADSFVILLGILLIVGSSRRKSSLLAIWLFFQIMGLILNLTALIIFALHSEDFSPLMGINIAQIAIGIYFFVEVSRLCKQYISYSQIQ